MPGGLAAFTLLMTMGVSASEGSKSNSKDATKPAAKSVTHQKWRTISRKEVAMHNTIENGVWVTYGDGVYDVTEFISNHPGGKEKLMGVAGQDIAASWNQFRHHKTSSLAHELLDEMKIGVLRAEEVVVPPKEIYTAKYPSDKVYDVIIIGAGLSGLQCGSSLVETYKVPAERILVLEAQDYVGGRVKQVTEFIKGTKIEVGAELLHGE